MANRLIHSRQLAFGHQGGRCYYCGLPMGLADAHGPALLRCTAEHLTARSEGGQDDPSNIVAACLHCNRTRHKRKHPPQPQRYREEVRRQVEQGRWFPAAIWAWVKAQSQEDAHRHISPSE